MPTTKSYISATQPPSQPSTPFSDDQQNAKAQGLTLEVYRLQERIRKLPLAPREDWLRKKRHELVDNLFATARRDRCLSRINPWAACDSKVPPVSY